MPACSDGLDNDRDGFVDDADDPGCSGPTDESEHDASLVCDDRMDNDGDGHIDYPADPECRSPWDDKETFTPGGGCGLGWELILLVPLLVAAIGARRRAGAD
jgi:hypothetical protein